MEKTPDADFLRHMIGSAAQRLMELEVGGLTGAPQGVKRAPHAPPSALRQSQEVIVSATGKRGPEPWIRVRFMRNPLAHAGRQGRRVVPAFTAAAFAWADAGASKAEFRKVAGQLRPKMPKLAGFMDAAEEDVLAYMAFPPFPHT